VEKCPTLQRFLDKRFEENFTEYYLHIWDEKRFK